MGSQQLEGDEGDGGLPRLWFAGGVDSGVTPPDSYYSKCHRLAGGMENSDWQVLGLTG